MRCPPDSFKTAEWFRLIVLMLSLAFGICAQPGVPKLPPPPDGELIQPTGHDEIYLLINGQKHHIENPSWFGKNRFDAAKIRSLTPAEVDAIPEGYPLPDGSGMPDNPTSMALEGMLLKDKDGRIFVVNKGARHWVRNGKWLEESKYAHQPTLPLSDSQLEAIPLGGDITYTTLATKIALPLMALAIFLFLLKGSAIPDTRLTRIITAVIFIAAIGFREPYLLQHPRFWAEEGLVWFQYGSEHSILKTLVYVFPASNYMNLAANVGAVLSTRTAAHFGLLVAPAATTWYSYMISGSAIAAILFVRSRLFDRVWVAAAGCMIVLFSPTTSDEIWLNSINAMSFLGIITLVILFAETNQWSKGKKWAARATQVFCGLSSPYSVALLPLFLVSAWRTKEREQKVQCLILIACVTLQAGIVVNSRLKFVRIGADPMRATVVRADGSAVNMFVEHMVYPALGFSLRERFLDISGLKETSVWTTSFSTPAKPPLHSIRVAGWLAFFLMAGTLWLLRGRPLFSTANMLMGAFLVLSAFTCVGSLYSVPTGRYAFMPGVVFLLLLLKNTETPFPDFHRHVCMAVLAYGLATGVVAYQNPLFQIGPSWAGEVAKWEADPSYSIRVWPTFFVSRVNITYPSPKK